MAEPALHLDNVTRRYGAIAAVLEATATFHHGRIHAVVGENGAGKSTLLGIAGGFVRASDGRVLVNGEPLAPATPAEATKRGIGFVHQHFMLVEAFSALDNIVLGAESTNRWGILDLAQSRKLATAKMKELDLELDLDALVSSLGVGQRQHLEILRVLVRGARTILLDEPTAVLTPSQVRQLFHSLRRMADDGACIVVVTHRIDEVLDHCNHVTVMRRGRVVARNDVSEVSARELTRLIMGQEPPPPVERLRNPSEATPLLEIRDLAVGSEAGRHPAVNGLSLSIAGGEIVGLAGIEGNGQQELVRTIAGLLRPRAGQVLVDHHDVTSMSVGQRRSAGLAVLHDDRHREGLMLEASVADNLLLGDLATIRDEPGTVARRMAAYGIVPNEPAMPVGGLSGGNQQKVVVARALDRPLRAAVLAQPTRGVDLGAARSIHEAILGAAKNGAAVLVVSADLAELRAICHRIAVLVRGRIVATLSPDASEVEFGRAMLGESVAEESVV